ncbi:DUF3429 domain-containing protein [Nitrogeniibacter mangrovi]|uniref:DUF3429 domain-containing protein n=1 Tax=Nitrogeniibacter mangrovi TaxID=2016596 RepID=A0A6C1B443_9RHOO|nr:DUF3429 domain-containing protein [Nitrogeniibacter mangrovi]QID18441.1 DUF3429 domain-containing protein [Nitrogeniibacter mangrovi]
MITLNYTGNRLPRALGLAGVLPFIAMGLLSYIPWKHQVDVHAALVSYGAVILAFVGALHWGLAMRLEGTVASRAYFWSVIPALIAWVALMFPTLGGALIVIVGLWTHYVQDNLIIGELNAPAWYLPLRRQLTAGATVGIAIALPALWTL